MLKIYLVLILSLATLPHAFSGIIKDSTFFDTVGSIKSFSWAPSRYQNEFRYDIFYALANAQVHAHQLPHAATPHSAPRSSALPFCAYDVPLLTPLSGMVYHLGRRVLPKQTE